MANNEVVMNPVKQKPQSTRKFERAGKTVNEFIYNNWIATTGLCGKVVWVYGEFPTPVISCSYDLGPAPYEEELNRQEAIQSVQDLFDECIKTGEIK